MATRAKEKPSEVSPSELGFSCAASSVNVFFLYVEFLLQRVLFRSRVLQCASRTGNILCRLLCSFSSQFAQVWIWLVLHSPI